MPEVTSVEKSLKRLITLCPDITLTPEYIRLIIDGNMNEVIARHRGTHKEETVEKVVEEFAEAVEDTPQPVIEDTSEEPERAFDEYFS